MKEQGRRDEHFFNPNLLLPSDPPTRNLLSLTSSLNYQIHTRHIHAEICDFAAIVQSRF